MRFAIFSDIHGNLAALDVMLDDLANVGEVDQIWCLGDFALMGSRPAQCIQRLRDLHEQHGKEKVRYIGGNTDRYIVTGDRPGLGAAADEAAYEIRRKRHRLYEAVYQWTFNQLSFADYQFLQHLLGRELHQRVERYGTLIGAHAIPGNDDSQALSPTSSEEVAADALLDREGRLMLAGHTHLKMDRTVKRWRVMNPGSVGMSFSAPGTVEWLLLTVTPEGVETDFRAIPYDLEGMLADAATTSYPDLDFLRERFTQAP
jgi:predicted phosphodiesterase